MIGEQLLKYSSLELRKEARPKAESVFFPPSIITILTTPLSNMPLEEGLKQVAEHLDGLLAGLASADADAQGFCATLLQKLVRYGSAEKFLAHSSALSTVVKVLENPSTDVDVCAACVSVISASCESGVAGAVTRVDKALGERTFSVLLARDESECVNGAFLLLSHVATLATARANLVGDKTLLELIFKSFSHNERVAHAANAFRALVPDSTPFCKENVVLFGSNPVVCIFRTRVRLCKITLIGPRHPGREDVN